MLELLKTLCGLEIKPERFDLVRDAVVRDYANFARAAASHASRTTPAS